MRVIPDQCSQRQRSIRSPLDEEPLAAQVGEDRSRAGEPDRLAEVRGESLEEREPAHQVADGVGMVREHLLGEVGEKRGIRLVDPREHAAPGFGRGGLQRLDREADGGRPPAGEAVNLRREVLGLDAEAVAQPAPPPPRP